VERRKTKKKEGQRQTDINDDGIADSHRVILEKFQPEERLAWGQQHPNSSIGWAWLRDGSDDGAIQEDSEVVVELLGHQIEGNHQKGSRIIGHNRDLEECGAGGRGSLHGKGAALYFPESRAGSDIPARLVEVLVIVWGLNVFRSGVHQALVGNTACSESVAGAAEIGEKIQHASSGVTAWSNGIFKGREIWAHGSVIVVRDHRAVREQELLRKLGPTT
jgi:hypothetical protein